MSLVIDGTGFTGHVGDIFLNAQLIARGGAAPYTWLIKSGDLPDGLTMDDFGGISGTPTATDSSDVTLQVEDFGFPTGQTAERQVRFKVLNAIPQGSGAKAVLIIQRGQLLRGSLNANYSFQGVPLGGTPPYTYSATGLPDNLTINSSTGLISGTLINAGRLNVLITVNDSTGHTEQFYDTFAVDIAFCVLCGLF